MCMSENVVRNGRQEYQSRRIQQQCPRDNGAVLVNFITVEGTIISTSQPLFG